MFGFLAVNKPPAITSRTALNRVSGLIKPVKAGHAGTLDPLATGVLILCIGPATRLVNLLQSMPKSYRARFRLGYESETEDISSPLIPVAGVKQVSEGDLVKTLRNFEGKILQQPPQYSALRLQGRRAYNLARAGRSFELKPREICVHSIQLIEFDGEEFEVEIQCGSGTYVRSLGRDIGRMLGNGAVMTRLQRTAIGPFQLEDAIDIGDWKQNIDLTTVSEWLVSPTDVLSRGLNLSEVRLDESDVWDLWHGRRPKQLANRLSELAASPGEFVLGLDADRRLIAIFQLASDGSELSVQVSFARYWLAA